MIENEAERRGIAEILRYLSEEELIDLALTVTNRQLRDFEPKDCVRLILNYSASAADFLKRKKIKKEIIFRFLNEQRIYANASSTKRDLIKECLKAWGSSAASAEVEMECSDEEECIEFNVSQSASQNHNQHLAIQPAQSSIDQHQWMTNQATGQLPVNQLSNQAAGHLPVSQVPNQILLNHQLLNLQSIGQAAQLAQHIPQTDHQIIELSVKFGEWFYSVLPEIERSDVFAVTNFWEDSVMGVEFEYSGRTMTLSESGSSGNIELLRKLIGCNLRFKPNLLPQHNGVRAAMEPHGLLNSAISGILYSGEEPVGWFDHLFGLIAENSLHEDRWRIKILRMKIKLSKPILSLQKVIDEHTNRESIKG